MKILVINAGSSSLKYQLIDMDTEDVIAKGLCERIGIEDSSAPIPALTFAPMLLTICKKTTKLVFDEDGKVKRKVCTAHKEGCSKCVLLCPFFKRGYDKVKKRYDRKKVR